MSWETYATWIHGQLSDYRQAPGRKDELVFIKPLEGDTIHLTLQNHGQRGGRLSVTVSFEARPF